ncbi:MAG: sigma-70 family RNA polymerase sigma factor [Planctomycetota bacterium]
MGQYQNRSVGELAAELSAGLVRLRKGYIDAAEKLAAEIEDDHEYPYEFVVYRLTGFRPQDATVAPLSGKSLRQDLLRLMVDISSSFDLPTGAYDQPVYDSRALAKRFNVSTKTVQRWRRRGLPTRRLVFPDGRKRIAFLAESVNAFVNSNPRQVKRSVRFTQLTPGEKEDILRRARRMARFTQCGLSEVARRIARHSGRAVETVRYTIRNHDVENPENPIFPDLSPPLKEDQKSEIYQAYLDGTSVPDLSRQYRRTPGSIYRVIKEMRARQLLHRPINYVYNPQFDLPNADETILDSPDEVSHGRDGDAEQSSRGVPRVPGDLPPYLKALYGVPLLTPEQERSLFQRYNYLKYKADLLRRQIDVNNVRTTQLKRIESLLLQANVLKNRIIRSNLRLVVSIAKRHTRGPQTLFELISDGNVALMRAVEKFDYAKGYRFSTYASWAIMRNYARSVPKERVQLDRFTTGHEEVLDIAAGMKSYDPTEMNIPELRESIDAVLSHLSSRERTILIDHYGLDESGQSKTFDQLGQYFGISKERVRQIEIQALKKLRKILRPQQQDLLN